VRRYRGDVLFEVAPYGVGGWQWQIELDEDFAADDEDAVARLVNDLGGRPCVDDVAHTDREIVLVRGTVAASELTSWLATWFSARAIPPSADAG
jgi:hypothetical protein